MPQGQIKVKLGIDLIRNDLMATPMLPLPPHRSCLTHRSCLIVLLVPLFGSWAWSTDDHVDFNRDIRPLLSDRCFACHGPDAEHREADLRLDQDNGDESPFADRGGTRILTPHKLDQSSLWERIISDDPDEAMPPPDANKPQLTAAEKELFKKWILQGAKYDSHWSFTGLRKQVAPQIRHPKWNGNRIDRFVYHSLLQKNLTPKDRADKRTLIRRVTLDLTGLPPTLKEIDQFLADTSSSAYENLVDRLINRPAYGEHMARYWLDLVRFADTNGIHHDHYREVTPYRDWVIDSFNENLSFKDFVEYQIAGDLYPDPSTDQLVASGFNRLHLVIDRGTALPEESFHRNVVDRVTAFGTVFLGLTVQCAQCHEHKYDPISQTEFFQLYAFFNNIDSAPETPGGNQHPPFIKVPTPPQQEQIRLAEAKIKKSRERIAELKKLLEKTGKSPADSSSKLDHQKEIEKCNQWVQEATRAIESIRKAAPISLVMKERKDIRETRIRIRGVYDQLGEKVNRGTPAFLPPLQHSGETPGRMDLAKWVTDKNNPLTARVAVNRFWQQFFGVGLVKTAEDFGGQGDLPSHPKLLDDLALRFMQSGWDVKKLVKEIVLSETYRQSSVASPEEYRMDPGNRRLARGSRFRLDAETLRDQILKVSGLLNGEMYGKSVKPPQPPNLWKSVSMKSSNTYAFKPDTGDKILRRSLYSFWKRAMPPPQMTIFDAPTRESCIARRERTNTPLQALVMMNESQYFSAAKHLAQNVLKELDKDDQRIRFLYESLTAHLPDQKESELIHSTLKELRQIYASDQQLTKGISEGINLEGRVNQVDLAAYTSLINSLFNLDVTKTRN